MKRNKVFYVYIHKSPSCKYYVGITSKCRVQDRWDNGNGYKNCPAFYNAILKYGWENTANCVNAEIFVQIQSHNFYSI